MNSYKCRDADGISGDLEKWKLVLITKWMNLHIPPQIEKMYNSMYLRKKQPKKNFPSHVNLLALYGQV